MRNIQMTVYVKNERNWDVQRVVTDSAEIYKSLAEDLIHKKLHACKYITSIKDKCNYDGTRTVTTYYDNGVKREYIVED